jgi:hypothetical protein
VRESASVSDVCVPIVNSPEVSSTVANRQSKTVSSEVKGGSAQTMTHPAEMLNGSYRERSIFIEGLENPLSLAPQAAGPYLINNIGHNRQCNFICQKVKGKRKQV